MKGVEFDFSEVKDALNKSLGYELHDEKKKAMDEGLKIIQDKSGKVYWEFVPIHVNLE